MGFWFAVEGRKSPIGPGCDEGFRVTREIVMLTAILVSTAGRGVFLKENNVQGCISKVRCLRIRRPHMLALLASLEVQVTMKRRQKAIKSVFKGRDFSFTDLPLAGVLNYCS